MKKLTLSWLRKHDACAEAIQAFKKSDITGLSELLNTLIKSNESEKLEWANWLIVRIMNKKQRVQYAIFAVESVIDIFEKRYPDDDRPRKAIEAAKKYLNRQSMKNRDAAANAANAAYAAYAAANAAANADNADNAAANAAAYADNAAANAAANAAYAANAAANAAAYAANAAYAADNAADNAALGAAYAAYAADNAALGAAYAAYAAANADSAYNRTFILILKNGLKILK